MPRCSKCADIWLSSLESSVPSASKYPLSCNRLCAPATIRATAPRPKSCATAATMRVRFVRKDRAHRFGRYFSSAATRNTRSFVDCGIAFDAGELFKIADTEQGARPARSATIRRFTGFEIGTFSSQIRMALHPLNLSGGCSLKNFVSTTWSGDRVDPFVGNQTECLTAVCDLADGAQTLWRKRER